MPPPEHVTADGGIVVAPQTDPFFGEIVRGHEGDAVVGVEGVVMDFEGCQIADEPECGQRVPVY